MTSITTAPEAPARPALQPLPHGLDARLQLWLADLDAYAQQHALDGLTPGEQERAARMAFEPLRRRSLAGRHVLRRLLGEALGRSPPALPLVADRFGKPHLADAALQFSLSHRDRYALVGLHAELPLGVDLEIPGSLSDLAGLARVCFSEAEYGAWAGLSVDAQQRFFFNCWTRKEACIKALGVGMSAPLPAIDVGGDTAPRRAMLLAPDGLAVEVRSLVTPPGWGGLVLACAWTQQADVARAHAAWG